jgi:RHS repeat-associated protein
MALDPATVDSGATFARWDSDSGLWFELGPTEAIVSADEGDATRLLFMPVDGWLEGERYRVSLTSDLSDLYRRTIVFPDSAATYSVTIEVPSEVDDTEAALPGLPKVIPLAFDTVDAATATLDCDGEPCFPGGLNLLFQGLWHDPVTGIAYARNRWYDSRTAMWLSEDPLEDIDSPNLYAFVAWGPQSGRDPMGLQEYLTWDEWSAANPGGSANQYSIYLEAYERARLTEENRPNWFRRKWDALRAWYRESRFGRNRRAVDAAREAEATSEYLKTTYINVEDDERLALHLEGDRTGSGATLDSYSRVVLAGVVTVVIVADDISMVTGVSALAKHGLREGMQFLLKKSDGTQELWKYTNNRFVRVYGDDAARFSGLSPSQILRKNMKEAGVRPPPYPNAAHHIVAESASAAAPARAHLAELGIDINSSVNGIFLRYTEKGRGPLHLGGHTQKYYEAVNKRILKTNTREEATEELRKIASEIMNGKLGL